MPSVVRERMQKLMDEQKAEAELPTSRSVYASEEPEIDAPEVQESESADEIPLPEQNAQESEADDIPLPETAPAEEQPQSSGDDTGADDVAAEPMETPEAADSEQQPEQPDWQSMLGYVGQQANDQLFDSLAINLAESTHRIVNRTRDKFDQRFAELDIGNSL